MNLFIYFRNHLLKRCLILLILFLSAEVYGQINYGLTASGDWNSYIFIKDVGVLDYKGKLNYSVGGLIDFPINSKLIASAGLNYTNNNYKVEIDLGKYQALGNDYSFGGVMERIYKQSFIELPLSIKYKIKERQRYYIYPVIGIVGAKRLKYEMNSSRGNADSLGIDNGKYNKFLLSTKIGYGIFFKKEKIGLGVEPNIRFYLNQVHLSEPKENPIQVGLDIYILRI